MQTWLVIAVIVSATAQAQMPASLTGTDAASGIAYALIPLEGKVAGGGSQPAAPPRLTAWCTKDAAGKLRFELLADAGDPPPLRFIAPWKQTPSSLFPPAKANVQVSMEFLGYVKQKPFKRQWYLVDGLPGELEYNAPGASSTNMETVMFFMQYLKALPTLRLTLPAASGGKSTVVVEFETLKWQAVVKAEPLCGASAL